MAKLEALKSEIEKSHSVKVAIIEKDLSLEQSPSELFGEIQKL
jgi:short-subunit dehydrogenase